MNIKSRFSKAGTITRAELFHDVFADGGGAGDDLIDTVGPWTGTPTNPETKFGLNPATGERYFVDDAGVWQSVPADLNGTHEVVAGLAPAVGTIPTKVSSQTRDDGDFHTIQYDDYVVVFTFPDAEVRRISASDGGFEPITLSAVATLEPSLKANWLREYTITATAPLTTITVDGVSESVVQFPLPAPTADGQRIDVVRSSSEKIHLDGEIDGDTMGGVINQNNRKIQLVALGAAWLWSH